MMSYLLLLFSFPVSKSQENPNGIIDIQWDFSTSLAGWANSNMEEMQVDLSYSLSSGELRGTVMGNYPHFDSPPLRIRAISSQTLVLRMAYTGALHMGKIQILKTLSSNPITSFLTSSYSIDFEIQKDAEYHVYYVPLVPHVMGTIFRIRIVPGRAHPLGAFFEKNRCMETFSKEG